jgi:hypothetical protein
MGIAATVTHAPSDADDLLDVEWTSPRDGEDGEEVVGERDLRWVSTSRLPAVGDDALLFVDSQGDPWAQVFATGAALADPPGTTEPIEAPNVVSAFLNSWVNFDADRPARYYKDRGRVFLSGLVKSGTIGGTIFTLPVGYRPASVNGLLFPVVSNGGFGFAAVFSSGVVQANTGSNVYFSLDSISFTIS